MPQARGSQLATTLYDETAYGVNPGSPDGKVVRLTSFSLKSSQNKIDDDTLTQSRIQAEPMDGNVDASGAMPMNLAAEDVGFLLKHTLGGVATYRPVKPPTTPTVTGVVFRHANVATPVGNGTLTWVQAANTLTWAAQGDTAGAAVDVSAGGDFTLQSNTASSELYITVTPGSLPVANQADADVSVVDAYKHVLTVSDLPTSFMAERDFGSNIAGSGRFSQFNGCRVASADFGFPQEGPVTASFSIKAANETPAATALDATPTDYGHTSFSSFYISSIEEGGAAIAKIKSLKMSVNNDLDEDGHVIGAGGIRNSLAEGFAMVSGEITAVFDDTTLLNKALTSTETSLKTVVKRGDGFGTASNESIEYLVPQMKYERNTPEVSGPKGVVISLPYKAYASSMQITLFNNVAAL